MKKIILIVVFLIQFVFFSYGKELEGKNLQAVNTVINANLIADQYEELSDKLNYLASVEEQIAGLNDEISDEASLICRIGLELQKENAKNAELLKQAKKEKKKIKNTKDPEKEAFIMGLFDEYKKFAESHNDLSSHFYFHYKETEFATMPYLSTGNQLKILKTISDDYKKIEEMNPDYGENLFTYGMVLCMMPKIAGGNKEVGLEKIKRACEVSATDYEKLSALTVYSQLLYEDKKKDEAREILERAQNIIPDNKTILQIMEMNEAGYSMFQSDDYEKKKGL